MKLNLIVETKSFETSDPEMHDTISKKPCEYCLFGQGPMCIERKYCRWDTHKEIFIKSKIKEV